MELIRKEDVNELIINPPLHLSLGGITKEDLLKGIDELDTIEGRPKGEWIDHSEDGYVECPFCREATNCDGNIRKLHYCWSCGAELRADMR